MLPDKIIQKVVGDNSKNLKEKQGYIGDLSKLSLDSLSEILDRQTKLLADRAFIQKLPDRGERIKTFKRELENEIEKRNNLVDVCQVMSGLTINGKELSDTLEWGGRHKGKLANSIISGSCSSDSEDDANPLKILANHSGSGFHQKKHRFEKAVDPLIKKSDLVTNENKIEEFENEPYVQSLCCKFDSTHPQERFLPFKTLVREKELTTSKIRDITAATPPTLKLNQAKQVTLQESLKLQAEQAQHLREVQLRHAAERLQEKGNILITDSLPPPETTAHYRESPPSDSEEEILDEDAKEERGGVTFPLANS